MGGTSLLEHARQIKLLHVLSNRKLMLFDLFGIQLRNEHDAPAGCRIDGLWIFALVRLIADIWIQFKDYLLDGVSEGVGIIISQLCRRYFVFLVIGNRVSEL